MIENEKDINFLLLACKQLLSSSDGSLVQFLSKPEKCELCDKRKI